MKKIILLTLLLLSQNLFAQHSLGIFGHYGFNSHNVDFRALPGVPNCCPQFNDGAGSGINLGAFYNYKLSKFFYAEISADYMNQSGLMTANETDTISVNFAPTYGEYEHSLDATLTSIGIAPMIKFRPFGSLFISLGTRIGIAGTSEYSQKEEIVEPKGEAFFIDTGTPVRNKRSGTIETVQSLQFAGLAGISYEIPLNSEGSLMAGPEIFYQFGINDVIENTVWSVNTLRAGLSIRYIFGVESEPEEIKDIELEEKELEIVAESGDIIHDEFKLENEQIYPITLELESYGVENGKEKPFAEIKTEEFLYVNMRPLLNYVFFDENSSELPDRYKLLNKTEVPGFTIDDLYGKETLPTYYNILNIVGRRMTDNPQAIITLTGCNSNTDQEKGNIDLSRKRAVTIKNYLTDIWSIEANRIRVKARNLPAIESNNSLLEGKEENRRVEIESNIWDITSPVITNDTLKTASPPVIRFYPKAIPDTLIAEWKLVAQQKEKILKIYDGKYSIPKQLEWEINAEKATIPVSEEKMIFRLSVENKMNDSTHAIFNEMEVRQLNIRQKVRDRSSDKLIGRYSLILFDYNKATMGEKNNKILKLIKENITNDSEIQITGHTDKIGDYNYNRQLSENRAKSVYEKFVNKKIEYEGVGEDNLLYDNKLPEGRFYCRTVDIYVETPLSWDD